MTISLVSGRRADPRPTPGVRHPRKAPCEKGKPARVSRRRRRSVLRTKRARSRVLARRVLGRRRSVPDVLDGSRARATRGESAPRTKRHDRRRQTDRGAGPGEVGRVGARSYDEDALAIARRAMRQIIGETDALAQQHAAGRARRRRCGAASPSRTRSALRSRILAPPIARWARAAVAGPTDSICLRPRTSATTRPRDVFRRRRFRPFPPSREPPRDASFHANAGPSGRRRPPAARTPSG